MSRVLTLLTVLFLAACDDGTIARPKDAQPLPRCIEVIAGVDTRRLLHRRPRRADWPRVLDCGEPRHRHHRDPPGRAGEGVAMMDDGRFTSGICCRCDSSDGKHWPECPAITPPRFIERPVPRRLPNGPCYSCKSPPGVVHRLGCGAIDGMGGMFARQRWEFDPQPTRESERFGERIWE